MNGDAQADLVIGAPYDDWGGGSGAVKIYSGSNGFGESFCGPALPNSTGQASVLRALGSNIAVENRTILVAEMLPPGQVGYFLVGLEAGFIVPPASSGVLCLAGPIGRNNRAGELIMGPEGSLRLNLNSLPLSPTTPVQAGDTWRFQCWHRDIGGTSNFTAGLAVSFF